MLDYREISTNELQVYQKKGKGISLMCGNRMHAMDGNLKIVVTTRLNVSYLQVELNMIQDI